jgi:hypothetical protein
MCDPPPAVERYLLASRSGPGSFARDMGDVYEGVFDEALAHVVSRCNCCNEPPAIGDLVTVWSSDCRVDARILKCPKCNGVPAAFAKRLEALRGAPQHAESLAP